jgi:endogenous inhibitor of DNA gyrase (YacG/DUF329 family)
MLDLGQWFAGKYSIPADRDPDAPAESPETSAHKPRQ